MTAEEDEAQRWVIYYKCGNANSTGWNWKLLRLYRSRGSSKRCYVFSYPSKASAERAAEELYGLDFCRIKPLPDNCPYVEYRVEK